MLRGCRRPSKTVFMISYCEPVALKKPPLSNDCIRHCGPCAPPLLCTCISLPGQTNPFDLDTAPSSSQDQFAARPLIRRLCALHHTRLYSNHHSRSLYPYYALRKLHRHRVCPGDTKEYPSRSAFHARSLCRPACSARCRRTLNETVPSGEVSIIAVDLCLHVSPLSLLVLEWTTVCLPTTCTRQERKNCVYLFSASACCQI